MLRIKKKRICAGVLAGILLVGTTPFTPEPVRADELEAVLLNIEAPSVSKGDKKIAMPEMDDVSVRFCADYEQVIGEDGTIYTPLEDKEIKGFYEISLDDKTARSEEYSILVPGVGQRRAGENEKPVVIPAIQEWQGSLGDFIISSAGRIIVGDEELLGTAEIFAEDYEDITGMEIDVISGNVSDVRLGDFYLSFVTEQGLGEEGYTLDIDHAVTIHAEQSVGAYWATRSILQILKQTGGSIPKGFARDYPKYEVRGLNLDVARKPFALDVLYDFTKNMSWYKLNSFQVHLSDNLIFMEDYPSRDAAISEAYAGFRLESGKKNSDGESASSKDLYYTKDEFRQFIKDSRAIGVDIVPELDFPAHALAFTRVFPEYMTEGFNMRQQSSVTGQYRPLIDELDISKPGAADFAKELWNEYLSGDNPVFDEETTVHIGTDEFLGGGENSNEYFRAFSNELITFIQDKGRTVRMWGSLSNKSGETPVVSEGVQTNIWSKDYGKPKQMYELGYDLINTADEWLYMVPDGAGARGAYCDYLRVPQLYQNWNVNTMYEGSADAYTVPAGDDQMLGACFAIWHDNIDTRASGISQYDSFLRYMDTAAVFSEKLWGDGAEEKDYADFSKDAASIWTAPNTIIGAKMEYATNTIANYTFAGGSKEDFGPNGFNITKTENAKTVFDGDESALQLFGGTSYAETPLNMSEPGSVLTMKVKMDEDASGEQILCESKDKFGTDGAYAIKASMKQTGNVGFSREGHDYSFNYKLPKETWVELSFHSGENKNVSLYVNGELADDNPKFYFKNHPDTEMSEKQGNRHVNTLLIPFGRIGSDSDSFKGEISEVMLTGTKSKEDAGALPQENLSAEACSVAPTSAGGNEGPAENAIDGRDSTYWHSNWENDTEIKDGHHWFKVTLNEPKVISKLTYLPRQDSANGRILKYSIDVEKEDGTIKTVADEQTWADDSARKTAVFDPIEAKSVTIKILEANGDDVGVHATIAELNLYEPAGAGFSRSDLVKYLEDISAYDSNDYTDSSWKMFLKAKAEAEQTIGYSGSSDADYSYAYETMQQAVGQLVSLDQILSQEAAVRYHLAAAVKELEDRLKNTEDYTPESVASVKKSVQDANDLLTKENASFDELSDVLQTLQKVDFVTKLSQKQSDLRQAVHTAEELLKNTSGYTKASVEALKNAVDQAKQILEDETSTAGQVDEALEALKNSGLVLEKSPETVPKPLKDHTVISIDGFKYEVINAGKKEVTLKKGKDTGTVNIPSVIKADDYGTECKVVQIADGAFKNCAKIKHAVIGDQVTIIGKNAFFGCKKLSSVTLGTNVRTIKAKAFAGCKKLKTITVKGKKAPSVQKNAFKDISSKVTIRAAKLNKKKRTALLKKMKKPGGMGKSAKIK